MVIALCRPCSTYTCARICIWTMLCGSIILILTRLVIRCMCSATTRKASTRDEIGRSVGRSVGRSFERVIRRRAGWRRKNKQRKYNESREINAFGSETAPAETRWRWQRQRRWRRRSFGFSLDTHSTVSTMQSVRFCVHVSLCVRVQFISNRRILIGPFNNFAEKANIPPFEAHTFISISEPNGNRHRSTNKKKKKKRIKKKKNGKRRTYNYFPSSEMNANCQERRTKWRNEIKKCADEFGRPMWARIINIRNEQWKANVIEWTNDVVDCSPLIY